MKEELYFFWKAPDHGLPEFSSGGHGVSIIPGLAPYVLLHKTARPIPSNAIAASAIVQALNEMSKQ